MSLYLISSPISTVEEVSSFVDEKTEHIHTTPEGLLSEDAHTF